MGNKKETVSNIIHLPEDLHKRLKSEAALTGKSLHDVTVDCVEKGYELLTQPKENVVLPEAS